ncbi:FBD-like protein [Tanacetum coccineum]
MFTCKTLTKFTIHFSQPYGDCPSTINLPCLKTLNIFFKPQNGIDSALKVIHVCPVLEHLSLESWCSNEDYNFRIPTLKQLKLTIRQQLTLTTGQSRSLNKVFLNVPNLKSLFVGGVMCSLFVMEDLSSLVEARLLCEVYYYRLWDKLLKELTGVSCKVDDYRPWDKYLLGPKGARYISLPICANFKYSDLKYPNSKRLDLKGYVGLGWHLFSQILESCSELEYLSIKAVTN